MKIAAAPPCGLLLNKSNPMPTPSKAVQYTSEEVDLAVLSDKAFEFLHVRPFHFQLKAAVAILQGKDVILDVGTGCGKSLCFTLPLLMNKQDISIIVSPLTTLMLNQSEFSLNYYSSNTHTSAVSW